MSKALNVKCRDLVRNVRFEYRNIRQETQLSLTNRATHLCKCNGVGDPLEKYAPPHKCYHAEVGRSTTKGKLGENAKFGERWGTAP